MKRALATVLGIAALAGAAPASAEGYTYQGPSYSYTRPPYSYQPPPYTYTPPSYTYEPPGYVYTPPGQYRRHYRANDPDYNRAYQAPSAFSDPRLDRYQENMRDPYNRSANPGISSHPWRSAPPYESSPR